MDVVVDHDVWTLLNKRQGQIRVFLYCEFCFYWVVGLNKKMLSICEQFIVRDILHVVKGDKIEIDSQMRPRKPKNK